MLRGNRLLLGCLFAAVALTAGCKSSSGRNLCPSDPLILSKKPIEGVSADDMPLMIARTDPLPPSMPVFSRTAPRLVHERPGTPSPARPDGIAVRPETVTARRQPVVATPVSRPKQPVNVSPGVDGVYGHAPDYRWLQGELDKDYRGHWHLRFCDHTVEHRCGGKVCLGDDPHLAQFQDGDVVLIEGSMQAESDPGQQKSWHRHPVYRVENIRLVRRKE